MKSALLSIFIALLLVSCTKDNTINVKETEIENTKDYKDIKVKSGLYSDIKLLGNSLGDREYLKKGEFPPDFLVNAGGENEFSLSDLRGKVVYLEFWRTKCYYCVESMPKFIENAFSIDDEDFIVITVSTDKFEGVSFNSVGDFINDFKMNEWINLYDGSTSKNSVAYHYNVPGTPQGYLIGRDGRFVQSLHPSSNSFVNAVRNELNIEL